MTRPDAAHERPATEPVRGLEDPRAIHPSPEGLFPDPGLSATNTQESNPSGNHGNLTSDEESCGIGDPRTEAAGPDL
jgi:hypothetical protein